MTERGDDPSAVGEGADLGASVDGEDLRAYVLDVERARDGLAGVACLSTQEHGLDPCIMQPLDGRPGAGAKTVLEREETDEPTADRDQEDRAPFGLELGCPRIGDRDAHPLLEEEGAASDDDAIAVRCQSRDTEAGVPEGAPHVVGTHAARSRLAEDRRREGMRRRHLRAGRDREDTGDVALVLGPRRFAEILRE